MTGLPNPENDGPGAAGHAEVELKYDVIDRAALEDCLGGPDVAGLAGGPWRDVLVEDRYVDTPDGAVRRAGYAARIRERDGARLLGLKSLTPARGALHRRLEIEAPAGDGPDPAAWPANAARDRLREMAGDRPLGELFRIRQRRRVRVVGDAEAGSAEISLDDVEILLGEKPLAAFPVLEVELRSGDESVIRQVAAVVEATGAVRASRRSKFEAALELVQAPAGEPGQADTGELGQPPAGELGQADTAAAPGPAGGEPPLEEKPAAPAPESPGPAIAVGRSPGISADDLFSEAGRKAVRFQLARLLAAQEGTRSGSSPADLHHMRVATRRMRAAWRVFGDAYRPARVRASVRALRTLGRHLGMVRDLDVLLDGLAAYAEPLGPAEQAALKPLETAWRAERDAARAALSRHLDSAAYRRFVEGQVAFAETPGQDARAAGPTDPRRVREMVPSRLWAAYGVARAYDGVLRWADLATLHQLRIAVKRLRDSTDCVREGLGPDADVLLERLVGVQDHLGALHDADVAAGLARTFLVEHSATLTPASINAVGAYLAGREREVARLRRTIGPSWRRVTSLEFRRGLGRAVAQL